MKDLMDEFNKFFGENAKAQIKNDCLEITIGSQTLIIQLPSIVGGQGVSYDRQVHTMTHPGAKKAVR